MSKRDDRVTLQQIRDHAREAIELTNSVAPEEFLNNRVLQLAVIRLVEILGEAATRVSQEGRAKYPELPWTNMIAIRNRLIHAYDAVNLEIVWKTVRDDLPPLLDTLQAILEVS